MQREIGSNFWLNPNMTYDKNKEIDFLKYGIKGNDAVLLSSGRSAQKMVLQTIQERNPKFKKIALIPPYTCETVIQPFVELGYEIHTYQIDEHLNVNPKTLEADLQKSKAQVVLFHRYFGFDTMSECKAIIEQTREKGIVFIEDRTQNLYSQHLNIEVDYIVGSFRKWTGLTDGGFAVCNEGKFLEKPNIYDEKLEETMLRASFMKYDYMMYLQINKDSFLQAYEEGKQIISREDIPYKMSPTSIRIQASLELQELKNRRQENYKFLFEKLDSIKGVTALTPSISSGDVPLYYAMLVENRRKLQEKLRNQDIYAPIIWPRPEYELDICDTAKQIYNHVLCIPIDQRYELDDMKRIIKCVKEKI